MRQALHPTTVHIHRREDGARESEHCPGDTANAGQSRAAPQVWLHRNSVLYFYTFFLFNNFLIMKSEVQKRKNTSVVN